MIPKLIEPGATGEPGREILIHGEEFLMGRGSDCDLRLSDVDISRHHCLIRIRGGEITLADLGSSNGTYVNGTRVVSQASLHSGDEIRVGEFRFVFEMGDSSRPDNEPRIDSLATTFKVRNVKRKGDEEKH